MGVSLYMFRISFALNVFCFKLSTKSLDPISSTYNNFKICCGKNKNRRRVKSSKNISYTYTYLSKAKIRTQVGSISKYKHKQ